MMIKRAAVLSLASGVALLATAMWSAPAVQAQDSGWMWGGDSTFGGSGRQTVRFSNNFSKGQVIVSFGDRRLYYIQSRGVALSYPIAVPKAEARWQGVTSVSQKRVNPSWTPTPSMIAKNPRLPRWVPGGHPMNPLGVRALYLGSSTYRIHGTDAPWLIGQPVSSGCIRMYNKDVIDLYPRVHVGAKVVVTWNRFSGGLGPAAVTDGERKRSSNRSRRVKRRVTTPRKTTASKRRPAYMQSALNGN